jgi:uncharacterized integral membrane protein (TIGR00698 family)
MMIPVAKKLLFYALLILSASSIINAPLALLIGILYAIFVGNPYKKTANKYAKRLLQYAIIGLGFGIQLSEAKAISQDGWVLTVGGILLTFLLGWVLMKAFKVEKDTGVLLTTGTAICGGSAIAAVSPVIQAPSNKISLAIGVVFILNAVALFLFPLIGYWLDMTAYQFGMWAAVAIHDTSSVVGAAEHFGSDALHIATTVKLTRALWIIPVVIVMSLIYGNKSGIKFPLFILGFIITMLISTFYPQGSQIYNIIEQVARQILIISLYLIGTTIEWKYIQQAGVRTLAFGTLLWIIMATLSLFFILSFY